MPLYHGSTYDIGSRVEPAGKTGNTGYTPHSNKSVLRKAKKFGQESHNTSFATGSEDVAWNAAEYGGQHRQAAEGLKATPRSVVYEVHPHPEMRKGAFKQDEEYVAPHFDVKNRIDIKPGHQGTLPGINFNEYDLTKGNMGDRNHPQGDDFQILHEANINRPEVHKMYPEHFPQPKPKQGLSPDQFKLF